MLFNEKQNLIQFARVVTAQSLTGLITLDKTIFADVAKSDEGARQNFWAKLKNFGRCSNNRQLGET